MPTSTTPSDVPSTEEPALTTSLTEGPIPPTAVVPSTEEPAPTAAVSEDSSQVPLTDGPALGVTISLAPGYKVLQ